MEIGTFNDLSPDEKSLLELARDVRDNAYAPYSDFYVGAALLTLDDEVVTGCNIELATIQGAHAEVSALSAMATKGLKGPKVIAINARAKGFDTSEVSAPCGSCRQAIFEFSQAYNVDTKIIVSTTHFEKVGISTISALLPHAFGPRDVLNTFDS